MTPAAHEKLELERKYAHGQQAPAKMLEVAHHWGSVQQKHRERPPHARWGDCYQRNKAMGVDREREEIGPLGHRRGGGKWGRCGKQRFLKKLKLE